ncbi:MAG: hypothetical protein RMJ17_01975 [Candidatus Aenigmarchaeota archaeon]|nr:hypothetical protein [Candidatus Aenigmarchaeota archaeon]MDW8149343.1 hypothetical protein [Candidatus Aenigmarchaeota archaeon]
MLRKIFAVLTLMITAVFATTDTAIVSVNVNAVTAIDINPASFVFVGNPGENVTFQYFQIENIGSTNITAVYATVTTTTSNPYGTGITANYNSGEFVRIDNTTNGNFYYVRNKNWNEAKPLYVIAPAGWSEGDKAGASWGYFVRIRSVGLETNEGEEYFAITMNGTQNGCNPGTVRIGKTPHTKSQTGTIDFNAGDFAIVSIGSDGKGSVSGVNPMFDVHTIEVSSDCKAISLIYWDGIRSLIGNPPFKPGEARDMRIMVSIPYGVPTGGAITGTLTVIAS